jgi:hypothetical protein
MVLNITSKIIAFVALITLKVVALGAPTFAAVAEGQITSAFSSGKREMMEDRVRGPDLPLSSVRWAREY